jgi:hypothetical protein
VKRTAAKLSCRQRSMIGATPHRYRVAASTTSSTAASASLAGISTRRERGKVAKQDATEMSASAAERGGKEHVTLRVRNAYDSVRDRAKPVADILREVGRRQCQEQLTDMMFAQHLQRRGQPFERRTSWLPQNRLRLWCLFCPR